MYVIVVMSSLEHTVRLPSITVTYCLTPIVTMEHVWIVLENLPAGVIQDTLETSVTLISMNVKQLDVRMENVKTSLMHLGVLAILGGLDFSVIQILMTVLWTPPDLDHVMKLEQVPVSMVTPHTHVSVWKAMLVMIAPLTLIPAIPIPVRMAEHAQIHRLLLLNVSALREFRERHVV